MATTVKIKAKVKGKVNSNKQVMPQKISKAGIAMRKGIGRGTIVELTPDPWNLH
ncbi:MAG: hypothetical protein Q7U86_10085 [Draconibacterium sp.]|nr:hypothetical protein [Draconibacterium sp.]